MKSSVDLFIAYIFRILVKPNKYYLHLMKSAKLESEGMYYLRLIFDKELRKMALIDNWIELV